MGYRFLAKKQKLTPLASLYSGVKKAPKFKHFVARRETKVDLPMCAHDLESSSFALQNDI
jgi:hypothetical protein